MVEPSDVPVVPAVVVLPVVAVVPVVLPVVPVVVAVVLPVLDPVVVVVVLPVVDVVDVPAVVPVVLPVVPPLLRALNRGQATRGLRHAYGATFVHSLTGDHDDDAVKGRSLSSARYPRRVRGESFHALRP